MLAVSPGCSRWRCCAPRMTPGAHGERRGPVPGMGMPGTGLRDQLPGAGARAAARPNRPISASMSASARPCQRDRGERARDDEGQRIAQRRPRRPRRAGIAALAGLDDGDEAAELGGGFLQHLPGPGAQAAQPASHGRGRDAQLRAEPGRSRAVQRRQRRPPTRSPHGVGAPGHRPRRQQDVRRAARAAPAPAGPQPPRSRRRAPGWPAPAPSPTTAAARSRTRGTPACRTPGPRSRPPRRRTAASGQASPVTAPRSPAGGHAPPGAVRVARCQASRRPATRTSHQQGKRHDEHPAGTAAVPLTGSRPPGAHGVVAHRNGNPPPAPAGTLTLNDASPRFHVQKEWRLTA